VFDCTAVPANLIEAELFGHERGAFTGAVAPRRGVFERADGGTLLIDEIGDLEVSLQSKLLRAIERGEVHPLGGTGPRRVDVRVIAATRRDLDRAVQDGRFRDDLFHRLAIARVELPPLRRRPSDVEMLTHHFWRELGGHTSGPPRELFARFHEHDWPGNVRELRNAVARYLALGDSDLAARATSAAPATGRGYLEALLESALPFPIARTRLLEEFQRRYVERVLEAHDGNVARAAQASGVARRYFQILKGGGKRRR
jgi:transcriptional regulator with GAF, ATPase, and Fis domain